MNVHDDPLCDPLLASSRTWMASALAQAQGDALLATAIDARALALALSRRAVAYLEEEACLRAAE